MTFLLEQQLRPPWRAEMTVAHTERVTEMRKGRGVSDTLLEFVSCLLNEIIFQN